MRRKTRTLLMVVALAMVFCSAKAQLRVSAGPTFSKSIVNSDQLNSEFGTGFLLGIRNRFRPENLKSLSFSTGVQLCHRKYKIENPKIDRESYNDLYVTFPFLFNFDITEFLLVNTGVELGYALFSNLKEFEYKRRTTAFLFGFEFLQNRDVAPFITASYSPWERLDYETIDKFGNTTGTGYEFKNFYMVIGVNIYINDF
ncbi:hypothetical protein OO013_07010 [Mangrovivirga sp. M17]|uniref:Outer membrane protein beta-barrel domain-containing protein n=1 Tax=Mangrovivirga halotolerans TaxID=2993936 RepID=A0ABT3RPU1_9BACT|nr:hypothetical protein [Mangrovivirga halotolerans]MCX2743607.1 hypothetical protein [Mangrovivirga halotolerans]